MIKVYIYEDFKNVRWYSPASNDEKISLTFTRKCICDYIDENELQVELSFYNNKYGKPFINSLQKIKDKQRIKINTNLYFSISHSNDVLMCAISRHNIGVDCQIINIQNIETCKKISKRFYSPTENIFLNDLPQENYINNFFKIWTKKEAYIKYTGKGIAEGLNTFSVNNLDDIYFKRVTFDKLSDAYIYLCYDKNNKDKLEVIYANKRIKPY